MESTDHNLEVAHSWIATYTDLQGTEGIVLEIRHRPGSYFLLHTAVRGITYHIQEQKYMMVLETFLSQLPADASIVISHQVMLHQKSKEQLTILTEQISRYGSEDSASVVYQLSLVWNGSTFTSEPRADDFTTPLYSLIARLIPAGHLKVCSFCNLLYIDGIYGGTDERCDMMYCFRDISESLAEVKHANPKSASFPRHLLSGALQEVDALHTCSSFTLTEDFDARIERAQ